MENIKDEEMKEEKRWKKEDKEGGDEGRGTRKLRAVDWYASALSHTALLPKSLIIICVYAFL